MDPRIRIRTQTLWICKCVTCFVVRIVGYADGAADPIDFPIAPKVATDRLLAATGIKVSVHS